MGYKIFLVLFFLLVSTGSNGYSESGSTLFDNGIAEFQKGRYQDAVFWFTKLIEQEPFNAKAYKNRGVARLSLQKYDMVIEDLNSPLNPDPQMEDITGNLGPAWYYKEEYKKAMDDFNAALNLDSELEGIHSNIGVAWYYVREYKKAIAEYDQEIENHPENYSAFFNRAISWVELKEYDNALKDLRSVLSIKPDEYWAIAYQGDIYAEMNISVAARESYLAAMGLNTGNRYARDRLLVLDDKEAVQAETGTGTPAATSSPAQTVQPMDTVTSTKDSAAPPPAAAASTSPDKKEIAARNKFTIQLGAFLNGNNAKDLIKSLKEKGYAPRMLELQDKKNRLWTLVRIGAFSMEALAKKTLEEVKKDLKVDAVIRPMGKF